MAAQLLTSATNAAGEAIDVEIGADGTVTSILPEGSGSPNEVTIDLTGRVLLPAAVEPHAHLDKAFLAEKIENPTGDLLGAIMAMRANRQLLTVDETADRAERAARRMAANGVVAIRTHADVTVDHGLTSIEALTAVRERVRDVVDIEIVALIGWPLTGQAGAPQRSLMLDALDAGADVLGGCPHLEIHEGDGTVESATDLLLDVAADRQIPLDLHTDETLDPSVRGLEYLAEQVLTGFEPPVTASHCVSLGQRSEDEQRAAAELVAEAGISVIALPHTNLFLQGRGTTPMPRGLTAVEALRAAGVNVAAGADNLQDPFNPVGKACPFETAGLMIMAAHLLPSEAWYSVSTAAAQAMSHPHAGLDVGARADLIAVPATTLRNAIAEGSHDVWTWRNGVRTTSNRDT